VRTLRMALLAQIIGTQELIVLPFYTYMQRYLQPQQRDVSVLSVFDYIPNVHFYFQICHTHIYAQVTRMLLYAAQACHANVPPDVVNSLIRCVADNFVSDRNSAEAITVGLNAITQILQRCPYAIDGDTLQDLTAYKKFVVCLF
jgi:protein SDA1